jgi:uncharacterized iron-regulated membrane protein
VRALIFVHRWLGVVFCLLFAMWFASGIVMHFVSFPHLTEAERFAGLPYIDLGHVNYGPVDAIRVTSFRPNRVRLVQRSDGPVYIVSDGTRIAAIQASDLSPAAINTPGLAMAIAADYARRRGIAPDSIEAALRDYDQWSVQGELDAYRPLYIVALHDGLGTELYVSSVTGEVVQRTTSAERFWNALGSVPHWLYFTALRSRPAIWSPLLWSVSLLALIATVAGTIIGLFRLFKFCSLSPYQPYQGWQAFHYWLGLSCSLFVLTWIFSGWLSMDNGLLFSVETFSPVENAAFNSSAKWTAIPSNEISHLSARDREVEWFTFGTRIYRRERSTITKQSLFAPDKAEDGRSLERKFLSSGDVDSAIAQVSRACAATSIVEPDEDYSSLSTMPGAPVYRVVCGATWYQIDSANGALLERLDRSRRIYRWLHNGLHTLDFPFFRNRPAIWTAVIVALCLWGLSFTLSGVVLAWRRLWSSKAR